MTIRDYLVCSDLHHGPQGDRANDETPGWELVWGLMPEPKLRAGDMDELWQFTAKEIGHLIGTDVAGNHDEANCKVQEVRCGDTIFLHGHQFDPWNSGPLKFVGKWITGLAVFLERRLHRDIDLWVARRLKRGRGGDADAYAHKAAAYAAARGATQIVFGHLHQRFKVTIDGVRVVCTGCCCNGNMDFVTVEVDE